MSELQVPALVPALTLRILGRDDTLLRLAVVRSVIHVHQWSAGAGWLWWGQDAQPWETVRSMSKLQVPPLIPALALWVLGRDDTLRATFVRSVIHIHQW